EHRTNQVIYVSATPGPYELTKSAGVVVEQVIRPTGLVDPPVEVRPVKGQIDDLLHEIRDRVSRGERVLVTTLTKRMAEDLAEYYSEVGVKCRYMHSEIEVLERVIEADYADLASVEADGIPDFKSQEELDAFIGKLEVEMRDTAKKFEFEKAAKLRDRIKELRTKEFLFA